jgi:UDP-2,3-diacylglucosamine pyrophosphatase LpxH
MSKRIKNGVKSAVKFINNFEQTAAEIALENKYDYVVCGHIHQPEIKEIKTDNGSVIYLNSGDWIENLTALEYQNGTWELYRYEEDILIHGAAEAVPEFEEEPDSQVLFKHLVAEFQFK